MIRISPKSWHFPPDDLSTLPHPRHKPTVYYRYQIVTQVSSIVDYQFKWTDNSSVVFSADNNHEYQGCPSYHHHWSLTVISKKLKISRISSMAYNFLLRCHQGDEGSQSLEDHIGSWKNNKCEGALCLIDEGTHFWNGQVVEMLMILLKMVMICNFYNSQSQEHQLFKIHRTIEL